MQSLFGETFCVYKRDDNVATLRCLRIARELESEWQGRLREGKPLSAHRGPQTGSVGCFLHAVACISLGQIKLHFSQPLQLLRNPSSQRILDHYNNESRLAIMESVVRWERIWMIVDIAKSYFCGNG